MLSFLLNAEMYAGPKGIGLTALSVILAGYLRGHSNDFSWAEPHYKRSVALVGLAKWLSNEQAMADYCFTINGARENVLDA